MSNVVALLVDERPTKRIGAIVLSVTLVSPTELNDLHPRFSEMRTMMKQPVSEIQQPTAHRIMAVSIRLRREGALNNPYYKVVVADQRSPRDGKFIEIIGNYDPKKAGSNANIDLTRADYWIDKGARPSDTVRSIIKKARKTATVAK